VKRVVSVSLGSSSRNKSARLRLLGEEFLVERIGTDGNVKRAVALVRQLDGRVDCFGLGGINRHLVAGRRRYVVREAERIARAARLSPVVDGGGLKATLEPWALRQLEAGGRVRLRGRRLLLVSAVDRFGIARLLPELTDQVIFGDLIFALGLPLPMRSLETVKLLGFFLLPLLCQMPIALLYPTGQKQEEYAPKYQKYFHWAEVILGDFLFIRRFLPPGMEGRTIITNTTRSADLELMRARGVSRLVTTTARIEGESFGQNVMEAIFVALTGKTPEQVSRRECFDLIGRLGWGPQVIELD
jgi:hypothetical protein